MRGCQKESGNRTECIKPLIKEKTAASGKSTNKVLQQLCLFFHLNEPAISGISGFAQTVDALTCK